MGFFTNLIYEQYFLSIPAPTASFAHKTVIITGANTGLGLEAARYIAKLGCTRLILGVRNVKAGETARRDIIATTSAAESSIEVWPVDLSSFASVLKFTQRASRELDRLDVLICNAAINTFKFNELEGYESTLTVNVLSTYLMATQLLPVLQRTAKAGPAAGDSEPRPPHLVFVGSDTHLMASFPEQKQPADKVLEAITADCKKSASRLRAEYAESKLSLLYLAKDLAKRQQSTDAKDGSIVINVANPGLCHSGLTREIDAAAKVIKFMLHARSTEMGGGALVNAASAGWETHGQFLSSNRIHQGSALSRDANAGKNLVTAVENVARNAAKAAL